MGIYKYRVVYWCEFDCLTDKGLIAAESMDEAYNLIKRLLGDEIESINVVCIMGAEEGIFSPFETAIVDWKELKNAVDEIYNFAETQDKLRELSEG